MRLYKHDHDERAGDECWHVFHELNSFGRVIDWCVLLHGCIGLRNERAA